MRWYGVVWCGVGMEMVCSQASFSCMTICIIRSYRVGRHYSYVIFTITILISSTTLRHTQIPAQHHIYIYTYHTLSETPSHLLLFNFPPPSPFQIPRSPSFHPLHLSPLILSSSQVSAYRTLIVIITHPIKSWKKKTPGY